MRELQFNLCDSGIADCFTGRSVSTAAAVIRRERPDVVTLNASRFRTYSGLYPTQDPGDPEERVWLCGEVPDRVLACTTHTASTSRAVALAQCRHLLNRALPGVQGRVGDLPVILGADLNLRSDRKPSAQFSLPRGYQRADDGLLQDVITSPGVAMKSRTVIDMRGATDHPGLLVKLTLP